MTKSGNKNAKSHGAYAQIIPPPTKDPKFEKLHRKIIGHFGPAGILQKAVVRDLATAWWHKRHFDRWYASEFAALLAEINAYDRPQSDPQLPTDLDRQIEDLERAFNMKAIKLAKRATVAKGKRAERVQVEIAQLDEARRGALAPLHACRGRQRSASEDSPHLRNFLCLEKAHAAIESRYDRCLRRVAMTKTFDELHAPKLLEHQQSKPLIAATAEWSKKAIANSDPRGKDQRPTHMLKEEDPDVSLGPYRQKKTTKPDDDDDWG